MCSVEELEKLIAESKQREATLALSSRDSQRLINELNHDLADLTLERDAALNALGIARNGMKTIEHCAVGSTVHFIATMALAKISDPAAALAERDRAIERKTAEHAARICERIEICALNAADAIRELHKRKAVK